MDKRAYQSAAPAAATLEKEIVAVSTFPIASN
jgi:hypothetical protein